MTPEMEVPTGEEAVRPVRLTAADLARRAEFEREALLHLDALFSFALKLSRSRDDAEDLVSDTMLRALERWEQYRLGTNIRAWLFTILYHLFVSRKRRIDAREVLAPDDAEGSPAFEPVGESDPEGSFYDSFIDEEVVAAIDALPEEYRSAVMLSGRAGAALRGGGDGARRPGGDGEVSPVSRAPDPAEEVARVRGGDGLRPPGGVASDWLTPAGGVRRGGVPGGTAAPSRVRGYPASDFSASLLRRRPSARARGPAWPGVRP